MRSLKYLKRLNCISSVDSGSTESLHKLKTKNVKETAVVHKEKYVDDSNVLPPINSVADGLTLIVEKAGNNLRKDAEKLLKRIEMIFDPESWTSQSNDQRGLERRGTLTDELESISDTLCVVQENKSERTFTVDTAALYLAKVQQALVDYELSMMQDLYACNLEQIRYDEENLLARLSRAKDASFEAGDNRPPCLKGTRTEVLHTLQAWATDPNAKNVFWLDGHAGSGKSAISQSFAEWLSSEDRLGASFFCSRDSQERSNLKAILPSIAFQIAHATNAASPKFRKSLLRALENSPDLGSLALPYQLAGLLIDPVAESGISTVVVIDGLDECKDDNSTSAFLTNLARAIAHVPTVKFFITSRSDTNIRLGFRLPQLQPVTETLSLHNVDPTSVSNDIRILFQTKLTDVAARRSDVHVPTEWPPNTDIDALVKKANGLFAFANAAVKYISSSHHDPRERMQKLLADAHGSKHEGAVSTGGLDVLYRGILERAFANARDPAFFPRLRSILSLLTIADGCGHYALGVEFKPSHANIAQMLGIGVNTVRSTLRSLHSVLLVPEEADGVVRVHHRAFLQFVADDKRCTDERFCVWRAGGGEELRAGKGESRGPVKARVGGV